MDDSDVLALLDAGDGSFSQRRRVALISSRLDEVARKVAQEGVGLDDLLDALDEEREAYYCERYGGTTPGPNK